MRTIKALVKWLAVGLLAVIVLGCAAIWVYPPELLRVGSGYAAKMVCSNVFIANRDPEEVMQIDVQAPGNPLLKLIRVRVDEGSGVVTAGFFGFLAKNQAVHRPGLGCAVVPDGDVVRARGLRVDPSSVAQDETAWPEGRTVGATDARLESILNDPAMTGPGMRAVVVVKDGRIVGESYGTGFSAETPLLGWSMTKTVTAALIGTLVKDGKMALDQQRLFNQWQGDARSEIHLSDLMAMSSGLTFNEGYGNVSDVTRMLYLEPDMAGFVAQLKLETAPGSRFNYSSGTTVLLSSLWQRAAADQALVWPRRRLFDPLGMTSAVLEADEAGTFVGSSYLYATGRDWARFGLLLLQNGNWEGNQILSPDYVAWMTEPAPTEPAYGRGQLWRQGPGRDGDASDKAAGLPADTFWAAGHDGQSMAVIPSQRLVVVRLGLTPGNMNYVPQPMVGEIMRALEAQ